MRYILFILLFLSLHSDAQTYLTGNAQKFLIAVQTLDAQNGTNVIALQRVGLHIDIGCTHGGITYVPVSSRMYALHPMLGSTATSHKWNYVDPRALDAAFRLVFTGSPTQNDSGVTLNGTTQYFNCFLNPSTVLTQTNVSIGVYQNGGTNTSAFGHGAVTAFATNATELYATTGFNGFNSNGENNACTQAGVYTYPARVIGSTDGSTVKIYNNGSQLKSIAYASGSSPNLNFYWGAVNFTGTAFNFINTRINFDFIGQSLTATQVASLDAAMLDYATFRGIPH